jgi:dTDP-4-amino-4,6-dideoxygalactose transaminase
MVDLHAQYETLRPEVDAAISNVLDSCAFILGPEVARFETAFADYHHVSSCVGVSNGTDALTLSLRALGIGEGDEVITTPHTFGATLESICHVGARPVLVDINPDLYTMRVDQIEAAVTERTKAILPVHIYGHPADMDPLMDIARLNSLFVIEDAAQAHGAEYKGQLVGTFGDVGCYSFYPGKNLGAYGDAGGIVTDNPDLADKLRMLRNHGQLPGDKFNYQEIGYNNRMDGIQGAVLNVKLPHLNARNDARRDHAEQYRQGLKDTTLKLPSESADARHVYHLFVVETDERQTIVDSLTEAGIASGVQYPHAIHLSPAYTHLGYKAGDFPAYEAACGRIVSFPMYPELTDLQIETVVSAVRSCVETGSRIRFLQTKSGERVPTAAVA